MRVLLSGGSGFLGSHIAEQLTKSGHTVRALVRRSSNKKFLEGLSNIEFANGTIEDRASIEAALDDVDAVIHSAGLVKARSQAEFEATNVQGTRNMLEATLAKAPNIKRFVHVSSLAAVGASEDGTPVTTATVPHPVTAYGRSKLAAEQAVLAMKGQLPVTVIRPPAIYGPRDQEIFAFFQSVQRGILPTVGKGGSTMSLIHGADCAAACIRAIDADVPSGSVYFVEDGKVHPLTALLEEIERGMGKKALLRIALPMPVITAAALASELYGKFAKKAVMLNREKINEIRQPHWVCDASDTRRDLGWEPKVPLADGVRETARWYKENGWL
jgi:nucleoside-diphosphate-sugar epimerase